MRWFSVFLLATAASAQISTQKEIALGKSVASDFERRVTLLPDPMVATYVRKVAARLIQPGRLGYEIFAHVTDSNATRATAFPGGYLYIDAKLILETHSEAELAAVLAHELAHVSLRHGLTSPGLATIPLIFLAGCSRFGNPTLMMNSLRTPQEREADLFALQYMFDARYDPSSLVDFFARWEPGLDLQDARQKAQELSTPGALITTSEFQQVWKHLQVLRPARQFKPPSLLDRN
jgi:predicted Zn-dependent protease